LALNKEEIVERALNGNGTVIDSPILPGELGFDTALDKIEQDAVAAIALIDKTDYTAVSPDGFRAKKIKKTENGETFEDLEELTLTLATINQPSFVRAAEAITEQAKAVGIKIQVETVEPSLFYEEIIKPRAYQLLLTATQYGRDADPYPFWHSSQTKDPGLNLSLYTNSKVDGLLEKARVTNNTEERAAAYQEFQKLIIADLPAIFLYQPTYTYAVSSKIKNISLQKIQKPADRFQNITDWYIKTKNVIE
jgi:peptide/nickel transport system substrate-binding protein